MYKKKMRILLCAVTSFVTILLTVVTFVIIDVNKSLGFENYKAIHYIQEKSTTSLIYKNEKYYGVEHDIFCVDNSKIDPIIISWNFNLPFTMTMVHYSYKSERPDYIFSNIANQIYINEDYDYNSDIFVVENTNFEIKFSDAFIESNSIAYNVFESAVVQFDFYSKTHPELYSPTSILLNNGKYYIAFNVCDEYAYEISSDFLEMLIENQVIVQLGDSSLC